jgi:hypothetical protein
MLSSECSDRAHKLEKVFPALEGSHQHTGTDRTNRHGTKLKADEVVSKTSQ